MKCKFIILTALISSSIYSQEMCKQSVLQAIKDAGICHAEIVMKQVILETNHLKSYNCRVRNNLLGITDGKGNYRWFDHWTESIAWYKSHQDRHYTPGRDYYDYLNCLWTEPEQYFDTITCDTLIRQRCLRYAVDPNYTNKLKSIK